MRCFALVEVYRDAAYMGRGPRRVVVRANGDGWRAEWESEWASDDEWGAALGGFLALLPAELAVEVASAIEAGRGYVTMGEP